MKLSIATAAAAATLVVLIQPAAPGAAAPSAGRSGTGIVRGEIPTPAAPAGRPMYGKITTAVANLPNRVSNRRFAWSMRRLTKNRPDFVTLNEVSKRSIGKLRATAPGYDAYRDPLPDTTRGGTQSMNNVVLWRTGKWSLLDAGRVKLVNDDRGYHAGRRFTWDRYATWTMLRRRDGSIMSVVSTHQMTNPKKYPRQHGNPRHARVKQYKWGMNVLVRLVDVLATCGPVLVGGDMNSHLNQGRWSAPAKMDKAGYDYAKNRGVLYLFHQERLRVVGSRQLKVASHHPALVTTVGLRGQGPS